MSHSLTIELSDAAFAVLQQHAKSSARSPVEAASAALEQHFSAPESKPKNGQLESEADRQAARQRFERHFGAVNLGHSTGVDDEGIDADLARTYADCHKDD